MTLEQKKLIPGTFRGLPLAAGALCAFMLSMLAAPACAQQIFIKMLYVSHASVCTIDATHPARFTCPGPPASRCPNQGNISNDPHIEFDTAPSLFCTGGAGIHLPPGDTRSNVCNSDIFLCTQIGWGNKQAGSTDIALDYISFEIFKFGQGTNPLDTGNAPPLRTFFVDDPGVIPANSDSDNNGALLPPTCVLWDGSVNIQGEFGKSNGQYGFRATVNTNQTGASGNINITQTRAYPSGATMEDDGAGGCGAIVDQKPIVMDVVNVHVVRSTPSVVGELTGVASEPYNLTYRLAKDATMYMTVHATPNLFGTGGLNPIVRTVVPGQPRVGEGIPNGTLQNGDSWNGRYDNGNLAPPGVYLATLQCYTNDQYGFDLSAPVTRQIALDTLQFTDIRVQPLTDLSTSLAVLGYMLTEPATVYIDIYPPGTQFAAIDGCKSSPLNNINIPDFPGASASCQDQDPQLNNGAPKNFNPQFNGVASPLLRHIEEVKDYRRAVINIWDGRDMNGNLLPDGDYVFVLYGALPSQNGYPFRGQGNDRRIWSTNAKSGFLTIARGMVTISQVGPSSTVIGSSPAVAGLDPFTFSYTLSRDAIVSVKIFDQNGTRLVKTLVDRDQRPGNFLNRERWMIPINDQGLWVTSGTYLVQLTAADPFFPAKVSTTTATFPINLFRITDVMTTSLLTGATDVVTINYQLSQPMQTVWNIYPPGTIVTASTATWPPCDSLEPGGTCWQVTCNGFPVAPLITIRGLRPGRLRITEYWDGRDRNGLFVQDGNYVYTLTAQSTTTPRYFATDKILGNIVVARGSIVFPIFNVTATPPQLFNTSQTISLPPYDIEYSLTRQSSVTIQILNTSVPPSVVRMLVSGGVRDANLINREYWDGRDDTGQFVAPGFYTVQAIAEDLASQLSSGSTAQQTISVNPLRIYDVAVSPLRPDVGTGLIAYQVSETMKVSIKIFKPGTTFDRNGNPFPPERTSLVWRIVGVRPARTEISDIWEGKDEKLTIVPDGNYIFKIVASTDINSIDSVYGNVGAGAPLAEDLVIAEMPVVRAGSMDPLGDFTGNTILYPNPVHTASANIQIYVPIQSKVSMKAYTLSGEMVLSQDFGLRAADTYVEYVWNKTNQSGRRLAHGVYFFLFREEPVRGEKTPLQKVMKVLIP